MTYCDTCGHQYSDVCGGCVTLDGVPVWYSPSPSDVRPIKDDGIIGTFDYATGNFTPTRKGTNADRIRAMTDEKLALFICQSCVRRCEFCIGSEDCKATGEPANGLLKWLRREAKE